MLIFGEKKNITTRRLEVLWVLAAATAKYKKNVNCFVVEMRTKTVLRTSSNKTSGKKKLFVDISKKKKGARERDKDNFLYQINSVL